MFISAFVITTHRNAPFASQKIKVVIFFHFFFLDRNAYVHMYPSSSVLVCMLQCTLISYICTHNDDDAHFKPTWNGVTFVVGCVKEAFEREKTNCKWIGSDRQTA